MTDIRMFVKICLVYTRNGNILLVFRSRASAVYDDIDLLTEVKLFNENR